MQIFRCMGLIAYVFLTVSMCSVQYFDRRENYFYEAKESHEVPHLVRLNGNDNYHGPVIIYTRSMKNKRIVRL